MKEGIDIRFMKRAISLAKKGVVSGGGPFGAVIVKDGEIIAQAYNRVTLDNDPTAHAEVSAIRKACKKLKTFDLSGCEIYTSCEPCPMCLSAIYWAHIGKIYYACTKEDAKAVDFDDSFIYEQIDLKPENRSIPAVHLLRSQALEAFRMWEEKDDKTEY
ncbi:nucleoside deaminase [Dysgonomonas sp. 511]|uniref:nucleoside deaminase n=1 Tax=Dysgonomonas sp. 511 TaxID=2302930 RepID=UPI0013D7B29E|nr:nucleoside deaminase [Dysgonomonas sp. 511]NDV77538.1 nucleoside deaminase [Dysgonomonas sp. 511]